MAIFRLMLAFFAEKPPKNRPQLFLEVIFKMAENAQLLLETHSKHIKQRTKISAFQRTLLEGHPTSQSVFIGVFVSIWPFLGLF